MEQSVNIKFCVELGKMPTETYEMVQTVYGNEALSRSSLFEWFKPVVLNLFFARGPLLSFMHLCGPTPHIP
jgi:hypothetical protein